MTSALPLFRKEVLDSRRERLHGDVHLAVPMAWQVIGYFCLAALAAAFLFLLLASYSRVETVPGSVVLDRGIAQVVSSRPGIVAALHVREGQQVRTGAPLAVIGAEEAMQGGGTAPVRMMAALKSQDTFLAGQTSAFKAAANSQVARFTAQVRGLARELASLDQQIAAQRRLVEIAASEFDEIRRVAERGFISRRDVSGREGLLLSRRQELARLEQARASLLAEIDDARTASAQAHANAAAQAAEVSSSRAEVARQLADVEASRGYVLRAPVDGTAAAVTARTGQAIPSGEPLLRIVPDNAVARAELQVPPSAIGFIERGQQVRLAVDAFPYQRFGTVEGTIVEIAPVAVERQGPAGTPEPVYLVTVALPRPSVSAFGRAHRLLPGMTLSARIVTRRQRLLEWLFEPLFAVSRR